MKINKYSLINYNFDFDEIGDTTNNHIVDLIYPILKERFAYLFEYKPQKHSLIYELSNSYQMKKILGKKFLYTTKSIQLTKEDLILIVETSDFYLGHLAIIISELEEEKIDSLVVFWENEIIRAGLKMIRMDSDGLSLLFYNMEDLLHHN